MTAGVQDVARFVRRHPHALTVAALFVAVGYLGFVRLDNTCFWDDEAQTAIVARNFLATGKFTGWDGRNLLTYRNGRLLDRDLNSLNPPLDYALTAASFRLFGQTTWAGRFPFVVVGLVSLAMFGVIVRRDFRNQPVLWLYALAVLGFSVVFLLNIRQCRYYAVGLLFTLLSYDAYRRCLATGRLRWYLVFAGAVIGLFYSNFLYCAAFGGALAVAHVAFHWRQWSRRDLWKLGVAAALVATATIPYAIAHRIWYRPDIPHIGVWYQSKPTLLWRNLREFNLLGLPWMVAATLIVVLVLMWRKDKKDENVRRLLEFACLGISYAVFTAMLSPQPVIKGELADIRFLLPVVPFLVVLVAAVLSFAHRRARPLAVVLFLVIVTTNLLSAAPGGWEFRWLLPAYIYEVHHDYPTAYGEVVAFLRENARQDDSVFAWPEYTSLPLMFYLGDKVRLCCLLSVSTPLPMAKVEELERAGAPLMLNKHYPDWIVFFGLHGDHKNLLAYFSRSHAQAAESVRMSYQPAALLGIYWRDTQRPELYLHSFGPVRDFDRRTRGVYIFRGKRVPAKRWTSQSTRGS